MRGANVGGVSCGVVQARRRGVMRARVGGVCGWPFAYRPNNHHVEEKQTQAHPDAALGEALAVPSAKRPVLGAADLVVRWPPARLARRGPRPLDAVDERLRVRYPQLQARGPKGEPKKRIRARSDGGLKNPIRIATSVSCSIDRQCHRRETETLKFARPEKFRGVAWRVVCRAHDEQPPRVAPRRAPRAHSRPHAPQHTSSPRARGAPPRRRCRRAPFPRG